MTECIIHMVKSTGSDGNTIGICGIDSKYIEFKYCLRWQEITCFKCLREVIQEIKDKYDKLSLDR